MTASGCLLGWGLATVAVRERHGLPEPCWRFVARREERSWRMTWSPVLILRLLNNITPRNRHSLREGPREGGDRVSLFRSVVVVPDRLWCQGRTIQLRNKLLFRNFAIFLTFSSKHRPLGISQSSGVWGHHQSKVLLTRLIYQQKTSLPHSRTE
jgi:hypothetical protein